MNARRLVGLYPVAWRDHYGEEFTALLEDRPPRLPQVIDIAWGAIDAHLFAQAPEGRYRMFTRLSGVAGIFAGLLVLLGFIVNVPNIDATTNAYRILAFYLLALVGLAGIHVRQVSVRPGLAWLGFAAAVLGVVLGFVSEVASIAGMDWAGG